MDPQQLRSLIVLAKAHDAGAFQALLGEYGPRLYGYFLRATRSQHVAEDLLGEISLRLVRKLESYDERGRFDQWLFRIAANMVRDRIRRIKARPSLLSLATEDENGREMAERISGQTQPVEAGMLAAEASEKLEVALAKLDETTRQMILLRHVSEMSFKDLAELFQCPLGTALARVHRGLKMLREWMDKDNGIE